MAQRRVLGRPQKNRDPIKVVNSEVNGYVDQVLEPNRGDSDFADTGLVTNNGRTNIPPDRGIQGSYINQYQPGGIDPATGMWEEGKVTVHEEHHVRQWPGNYVDYAEKQAKIKGLSPFETQKGAGTGERNIVPSKRK